MKHIKLVFGPSNTTLKNELTIALRYAQHQSKLYPNVTIEDLSSFKDSASFIRDQPEHTVLYVERNTTHNARSLDKNIDSTHTLNIISGNKFRQQLRLKAVRASVKTRHYQDLNFQIFEEGIILEDGRRYMVKPVSGTCSRGIFNLTASARTSIGGLLKTLKSYQRKEIDATLAQVNFEKYGCAVPVGFFTVENTRHLSSYLIVDEVQAIKAEYRLFTDAFGQVCLTMHRERALCETEIVSPINAVDTLEPEPYTAIGAELFGEMKHFIGMMGTPLVAYDVFVTTDQQWGIFEFSEGFSRSELPHGFVGTILASLVEYSAGLS